MADHETPVTRTAPRWAWDVIDEAVAMAACDIEMLREINSALEAMKEEPNE